MGGTQIIQLKMTTERTDMTMDKEEKGGVVGVRRAARWRWCPGPTVYLEVISRAEILKGIKC
jgi:hypothetical protein